MSWLGWGGGGGVSCADSSDPDRSMDSYSATCVPDVFHQNYNATDYNQSRTTHIVMLNSTPPPPPLVRLFISYNVRRVSTEKIIVIDKKYEQNIKIVK